MEILSQEQIDVIRHDLGLDRNLAVQYVDWLGHALRGDLGKSIINRSEVADEIVRRLPISMYLAGIAFIISIIVGIPSGSDFSRPTGHLAGQHINQRRQSGDHGAYFLAGHTADLSLRNETELAADFRLYFAFRRFRDEYQAELYCPFFAWPSPRLPPPSA